MSESVEEEDIAPDSSSIARKAVQKWAETRISKYEKMIHMVLSKNPQISPEEQKTVETAKLWIENLVHVQNAAQ